MLYFDADILVLALGIVWLRGWTEAGIQDWSFALARGREVGKACVWCILTATFVVNACPLISHRSVQVFLTAWFAAGFFAGKDSIIERFERWQQKLRSWWLQLRCLMSRPVADASGSSVPLMMIEVSVLLPSGDVVLSDLQMPSYEYARELRITAESRLGIRGSNTKVKLVFNGTQAQDSDRLADLGVCDGSIITAVKIEQEVQSEVPARARADAGVTDPGVGPWCRALSLVFWCVCEVIMASVLFQITFN
eukprot:TRINITY_DN25329_c0_g1_i2.p1 TRINITY_DN25329_c0_g1~~TRINITY_DN25329_c0_g1_i2.p1  ORF type:complete len:264 (-),score=38.90 TRINITY_DN25329_c0_g1_i2:257-1009(-)